MMTEQFTESQLRTVNDILLQEYYKGVQWGIALTIVASMSMGFTVCLYFKYANHIKHFFDGIHI